MAIVEKTKDLANRLFAPDPPGLPVHELKGIPGNVQRILDDTAAGATKKVWSGMVGSLGVGLGKGILIAAAIIMIGSGLEALALGGGFVIGALQAITPMLSSASGLAWLGIGGLLGSIMEIHQKQNKVTAEIAKAEATAFEAIRVQKQLGRAQDLPEVNFAAREMAKREMQQQEMRK